MGRTLTPKQRIVINLSGRGDKDMQEAIRLLSGAS
jgi:tryptophan synthase beta subunit